MKWREPSLSAIALALVGVLSACQPAQSPSPVADGWRRIPVAEAPTPGGSEDIVVVDGVIVVAGSGQDGPFVLTSINGRDWTLNAIDEAGVDVSVVALAAGPPGLVLLTGAGPADARVMGIRSHTDGNAWRTIRASDMTAEPRVEPVDIAWTGTGFVAVGSRPSGGDAPRGEAVAFSSPDGITWTREKSPAFRLDVGFWAPDAIGEWRGEALIAADRIPAGQSVLLSRATDGTWTKTTPPSLGTALVDSILATRSGLLVGGCDVIGLETQATVWLAREGPSGEFVASHLDAAGSCVHGLGAGPRGFIAVGKTTDGAAAWSSTDGITWTREKPDDAFRDRAPAEANAVANYGPGWVAAGTDLLDIFQGRADSVAIWRRP